VGQGETEEAALEDAKMALESTPEAGDGEAANGAEDLGGTPHPFDARLNLEALASEQGVEPADAWIAVTALEHDLPLITNNAGHYAGVEGLTIVAEISQPE
jgi:hypothetical protein